MQKISIRGQQGMLEDNRRLAALAVADKQRFAAQVSKSCSTLALPTSETVRLCSGSGLADGRRRSKGRNLADSSTSSGYPRVQHGRGSSSTEVPVGSQALVPMPRIFRDTPEYLARLSPAQQVVALRYTVPEVSAEYTLAEIMLAWNMVSEEFCGIIESSVRRYGNLNISLQKRAVQVVPVKTCLREQVQAC